MLVAKRASNLNDILLQSEFVKTPNRNWLTDLPILQGMYPCGHFGICKFIDRSNVFTNSDGTENDQIKHFICTTRIYYGIPLPTVVCRENTKI